MQGDGSASVFCFTPQRVPVNLLTAPTPLAVCAAADDLPPTEPPPCPLRFPALATGPLPTEPCPVCPRLQANFDAYRELGYYRDAFHRAQARAKAREQDLQQQNAQLQARVRHLEQQLFGRKTETASASAKVLPTLAGGAARTPSPRRRGQQRGRPGPKRRDYSHLPTLTEIYELPTDQQHCQQCGQAFAPFPGTEDATVLEVEVRAYRRRIQRRRYRPGCTCAKHPGIVTAPAPAKVIPKSLLGTSVWVEVLLDKYLFYRPTYRLLADWQTLGLDLSLGTVTEGLRHLAPLFEPLYAALVKHSQQQPLWHADETRWLVFASVEGKVGYHWYLWVFHAEEVVVFILAQGRAHDVPEAHLGPVESGIMVVDRYKAYQAIDKVKQGLIVLAFCWAHVRRDFLTVVRSWPALEGWALGWVQAIGELYHRNEVRVQLLGQSGFAQADQQVRQQVQQMHDQAQAELAQPQVHPAVRKTLESLGDHWTGLTVFVEHPEVPMDNNTAERVQRGPVVGRKNYYGSGAVWAGQLASTLFSLFQTLALWNLNPRLWLQAYLEGCAQAGGKAPADVSGYMPWNLKPEQREAWRMSQEAANPRPAPQDTS
jgi:transposase